MLYGGTRKASLWTPLRAETKRPSLDDLGVGDVMRLSPTLLIEVDIDDEGELATCLLAMCKLGACFLGHLSIHGKVSTEVEPFTRTVTAGRLITDFDNFNLLSGTYPQLYNVSAPSCYPTIMQHLQCTNLAAQARDSVTALQGAFLAWCQACAGITPPQLTVIDVCNMWVLLAGEDVLRPAELVQLTLADPLRWPGPRGFHDAHVQFHSHDLCTRS